MPELPKSIVIEGRRYPTWALSLRARENFKRLQQVDEHIATLRERLAFYTSAKSHCLASLKSALPSKINYYWHNVPLEWARAHWLLEGERFDLSELSMTDHYRASDRVLVYVKGHGVVGWGEVQLDTHSTQRQLAWRFRVKELKHALPAKRLKEFAVRHPNRASQALPEGAKSKELVAALETYPSAVNVAH
ncbi:hypothetical protein [Vreelandella sp. EE27]